jgi:hypothetical protein
MVNIEHFFIDFPISGWAEHREGKNMGYILTASEVAAMLKISKRQVYEPRTKPHQSPKKRSKKLPEGRLLKAKWSPSDI